MTWYLPICIIYLPHLYPHPRDSLPGLYWQHVGIVCRLVSHPAGEDLLVTPLTPTLYLGTGVEKENEDWRKRGRKSNKKKNNLQHYLKQVKEQKTSSKKSFFSKYLPNWACSLMEDMVAVATFLAVLVCSHPWVSNLSSITLRRLKSAVMWTTSLLCNIEK